MPHALGINLELGPYLRHPDTYLGYNGEKNWAIASPLIIVLRNIFRNMEGDINL